MSDKKMGLKNTLGKVKERSLYLYGGLGAGIHISRGHTKRSSHGAGRERRASPENIPCLESKRDSQTKARLVNSNQKE